MTCACRHHVQGCEQQSCSTGSPAVMITDHVPAVRLPPHHAGDLMAAAIPARGYVEDRRDPDPAPPGRHPAAPSGAPPEADLGGPGTARDPVRRDTGGAPPETTAAGHPGHDHALAPRHRSAPLGGAVHARQDWPTGDAAEHQGPGPATGLGDPQDQRHRPLSARDQAGLSAVPALPGVQVQSTPTHCAELPFPLALLPPPSITPVTASIPRLPLSSAVFLAIVAEMASTRMPSRPLR